MKMVLDLQIFNFSQNMSKFWWPSKKTLTLLAWQQDFLPEESLKNFWVLVKLMLEDRNTFWGKESSSGVLKLETGVIDFDLQIVSEKVRVIV